MSLIDSLIDQNQRELVDPLAASGSGSSKQDGVVTTPPMSSTTLGVQSTIAPSKAMAEVQKPGKPKKRVSSCQLCKKPDTLSMVACGVCDLWFHFRCVGVDKTVADRQWNCDNCSVDQQHPVPSHKSVPTKPASKMLAAPAYKEPTQPASKASSVTSHVTSKRTRASSTRSKALRLEKLEEERRLNAEFAEKERAMKEQRDKEFIDAMKKNEENFLNSKYDIENSSSGSSTDDGDTIDSTNRTTSWIRDQCQAMTTRHEGDTNKPSSVRGVSTLHPEGNASGAVGPSHRSSTPSGNQHRIVQSSTSRASAIPVTGAVSFLDPWCPSIHVDPTTNNPSATVRQPHCDVRRLSEKQMTARLMMAKTDLPHFSGNPGEWPMFINAYTRSTERCGYTDEDNLERLLKSLQGDARKLVKARLLSPKTVNSVIDTLYRFYGRPDMILDELIENVRRHPVVKYDRIDSLMGLSAVVEDLCATVENSMMDDHLNNPILLKELVRKLPTQLQLSWSLHTENLKVFNLSAFNNWLITIANAASRVPRARVKEDHPEVKTTIKRKETKTNYTMAIHDSTQSSNVQVGASPTSSAGQCLVCNKGEHSVEKCAQFLAMTKRERWEVVNNKRLCRTCLGKHFRRCTSDKRCGVDECRRFHHALLHSPIETSVPVASTDQSKNICDGQKATTSKQHSHQHHHSEQRVLYRIVPVILYGPENHVKTFAFIDEGSSVTLLEESVAHELQLDGPQQDLCLRWTGEMSRVEEGSNSVMLDISGIQPSSRRYNMRNVNTVKNLELPTQSLSSATVAKHRHLDHLPVSQYEGARPTILIGLDQYKLGLPLEIREGDWGEPVAAKTRLGWTVYGGQHNTTVEYRLNFHRCDCTGDADLHTIVKEFFSLESFGVGSGRILENKDDLRAKEIMAKTTKLVGERYETGLLWRFDQVTMPYSRDTAMRRLICFEKKLRKDPNLMNVVNEMFEDYLTKGYARKLEPEELPPGRKTWYLPVFLVRNPNKPEKVRLIWDAAAKSKGVSLNDLLLKGLDQLSSLLGMLLRFREKRIAITGDIREMFHQVEIIKGDRDAQRFLWRSCDDSKEPEEYIMRVMIFGATCAPSSAQYVKNSHAEKYVAQFPRAVRAIQRNHYVDDWLDSFDTIDESIQTIKEVINIQKGAGFEIRNWVSNSQDVLNAMGEIGSSNKSLNCLEGSSDKVLGMWWRTVEDVLEFRINPSKVDMGIMDGSRVPTKRQVLSMVMSIFDPLGLISTYLIHGKIILQDIWRAGTDWDEAIGEAELTKWRKWTTRLFSVEQLKIPRTYLRNLTAECKPTYDLHIFVDAGEDAYAAVAYLRASHHGMVDCTLISSKTRVSPTKPTSIPRLELLAAVMGVRLMKTICEEHTIPFESKTFWSDSTTVLSWLRSDTRRYKQFVAFRVCECLESTDLKEWRYVPTKLNVADEGTKWYSEANFSSSRWFCGPEFLLEDSARWPDDVNGGERSTEELRPHLIHSARVQPTFIVPEFEPLCTWGRMVRSQAYFGRAVQNFKRKRCEWRKGALTYEEMHKAENILFRKAQWEAYKDEVTTLTLNPLARVAKTSSLISYSPYLDDDGVLRMKGRIDKAAHVRFETKRPVILPTDHPFSHRLVEEYHRMYLHQNHETIINEIRQRYAIPRLRVLYRTIRSRCQHCKVKTAKPEPPEMSALPADRMLTFVRPFTIVGLDYFGPMNVTVGRRTEKRWGVLLTCLSVRAIHLELVNSLTSDSCIRALIMFISRRGTPQRIYSDNATTFHGANNALVAELRKLNENVLADRFTNIEWRFIPPGAPHFGGSWERLVKTVKVNLYATLPERQPSEEILRTCLAEVESIVNTRPLTHIPLEDEEDEALTPNHFILGSSSGCKPMWEVEDNYLPSPKSWKISQDVAQRFWRRFVREYLPELARRSKWFAPVDPLKVGDLVFIVDERNARGYWPRGKIVDVQQGNDGQIRSAIVQTNKALYTRPASKLAKIDVKGGQKSRSQVETIDQGGECYKHGCA